MSDSAEGKEVMIRFLRTQKERNVYDFRCQCGAEGELGLAADQRTPFPCPEGCGRVYVQYRDHRGRPTIRCVVEPMEIPPASRVTKDGSETALRDAGF